MPVLGEGGEQVEGQLENEGVSKLVLFVILLIILHIAAFVSFGPLPPAHLSLSTIFPLPLPSFPLFTYSMPLNTFFFRFSGYQSCGEVMETN